jgi:hypothetical protein
LRVDEEENALDGAGDDGDDVLDVSWVDAEVQFAEDLLCVRRKVPLRVFQLLNLALRALAEA